MGKVLEFIGTIEDDEEVPMLDEREEGDDDDVMGQGVSVEQASDDHTDTTTTTKKKKSKSKSANKKNNAKASSTVAMDPSFTFSMEGTPLDELRGSTLFRKGAKAIWDFESVKEQMRKKNDIFRPLTSIDEKISKHRVSQKKTKKEAADNEDLEEEDVRSDEDDGNDAAEDASEASDSNSVVSEDEEERDSASSQNESDDAESEESDGSDMDDDEPEDRVKDRRSFADNNYFADADELPDAEGCTFEAFTEMNLSRPILKGLTDVGFVKPTRIQAMTVPIALTGKDICGGAVTGSGKTAAFLVPVLERLLYRPKTTPTTRVLILTPTRELAAQCYSVAVKLAKYTDIAFCLCVGGASTQQQEAELRKRPDVVIATPGRLVDHVRNSACFGLDTIEILIMDEADRMLEEGFQAELTEIIKDCPRNRQTLLFSATMTDNVDQLISLSLNRPVRLFIDAKNSVAHKLTQEFIRVRPSTAASSADNNKSIMDAATFDQREAILLALCKRTYTRRVIVFVPSKVECHRLKIIFGLHGISAAELHGNLTQLQRIESLEQFRDSSVDVLLATDLAARGLDITGVETVINFQMPPTYERYVHRVGRTARYERSGRAVTLVGEKDRKLVKLAVKNLKSGQSVKQRVIPAEVIQKYRAKIQEMEGKIKEVLKEEKEEKELRNAEMSLTKAENMLHHEDAIKARPARTWFQSEKERQQAKQLFRQLAAPSDKTALEGDDQAADDQNGGHDDDERININAEIAKHLSKPFQRSKDAGLSRKQKRKRMIEQELEEDPSTFHQQQAQQQIAVKKAKRQARSFTTERGMPVSKMVDKAKEKKKAYKMKKPSMRFDREFTDGSKKSIVGGRSGRKVETKGKNGKGKRK